VYLNLNITTQMSLHTLYDGSRLRIMGAKELIELPVWNGNRIMDIAHVQKIKSEVGNKVQKLDYGYRIVTYDDEDAGGNPIKSSRIIDGQHRHKVLCDYFNETLCEPDFNVVVLEKQVNSESEIITCFKELNNQKPISWKSDAKVLAMEYIKDLQTAFNTKKDQFIKESARRPNLSVDKLRDALVAQKDLLTESTDKIKAFVERVKEYNKKGSNNLELTTLDPKKDDDIILKKALKNKFMLAVDPKLAWIKECLKG